MKDKMLMIINERKIELGEFAGFEGYIRAIFDISIKEKELREKILKLLNEHTAEYFWAGVYLGKTKPHIIKVDYSQIKKEEKPKEDYLG